MPFIPRRGRNGGSGEEPSDPREYESLPDTPHSSAEPLGGGRDWMPDDEQSAFAQDPSYEVEEYDDDGGEHAEEQAETHAERVAVTHEPAPGGPAGEDDEY